MFKIERKNEKGTKGEKRERKYKGREKKEGYRKRGGRDEQFDLFSVMFAMKCMILSILYHTRIYLQYNTQTIVHFMSIYSAISKILNNTQTITR